MFLPSTLSASGPKGAQPATRTADGIIIPHWREVTELAIDAAKVLTEVPLVGWDIAPVDTGAVIVELNERPDFKLHQLADRRGMMDSTFLSFLAERRNDAAAWMRQARQERRH
jgi:hypothetical protein